MGRYSRQKGVSFEREIARKLRSAGFAVRRNLEYDGFCTGTDLIVGALLPSLPGSINESSLRLPVSIQCKSTARDSDLIIGLEEAKKVTARLHVSIHRYNRKLRILVSYPIGQSEVREALTWDDLLTHLHRLAKEIQCNSRTFAPSPTPASAPPPETATNGCTSTVSTTPNSAATSSGSATKYGPSSPPK